jgi:hypothetical protein
MDGFSQLLLLLPILVLPPHIMISKLLELHTAPPPPWSGFLEISFIRSIFNTVLCYMCQPERSFISEIHRKYTHTYVYVDHWERDLGFFKTIPDDDCCGRKAPELMQSSKPAAATVAKLG